MRHGVWLALIVLMGLTGCGTSTRALEGDWWMVPRYDHMIIGHQAGGLVAQFGGMSLAVNTDRQPPTINFPGFGEVPMTLEDNDQALSFVGMQFLRDKAAATQRYRQTARARAQEVLDDLYATDLRGVGHAAPSGNCGGEGATVRQCAFTWDPANHAATFTLTLPFEVYTLSDQELSTGDDLSLISGHWGDNSLVSSSGDESIGSQTELKINRTARSDTHFAGTVEYTGRQPCSANLYLIEQRGNAARVRVADAVGTGCPTWKDAYWLSGTHSDADFIGTDLPIPNGSGGFIDSRRAVGFQFWRVSGTFTSVEPLATVVNLNGQGTNSTDPSASADPHPVAQAPADPTALPSADTTNIDAASSSPLGTSSPGYQLVKPLSDPAQSGVPRLYDHATTLSGGAGDGCALIDPGNPVKRCQVTVSSSGPYAWGSAWCSENAKGLTNFLNHATVRYEIDGRRLDTARFWEGRTATCLKRRLIVQELRPGQDYEFKLITILDRALVDGPNRYPAGRYELALTVQPIR